MAAPPVAGTPIRLVTARRSSPAASFRIYTERTRRALEAAGATELAVVEREMSAESARGGVVGPTWAHWVGSFGRHPGIVHATEPNTALRHVDVVTLHDLYPYRGNGPAFGVFRWVIRSAARRARRIVTQVPSVRDDIARFLGADAAAKTRIVPPSFPAPPPGRSTERYDVLWVGSVDPRKAPDRFLAEIAQSEGGPWKIEFLCHGGPSPLRDKVEAAAAAARRRHTVDWTPAALTDPELDALYRSSRVLVSTSVLEGFHYPVMEAWSRGTRVVVPRISPYPETYGTVEGVRYYDPSVGFETELRESWAAGPFVPDPVVLGRHAFAAVGARLLAVYGELLGPG